MNKLPFNNLSSYLNSIDHFILLESTASTTENRYSYLFTDPINFIHCKPDKDGSFKEFFSELERTVSRNYCAGFIPYETGYKLHKNLEYLHSSGERKITFGVYTNPYVFDHKYGKFTGQIPPVQKHENTSFDIGEISLRTPRTNYIQAIDSIQNHIAEGNTYQVNYTTRLDFNFSGSPIALYETLRSAQPTSYCALMRFGSHWILSLSPELFFKIEGNTMTARPMKGTMRRGRTNDEDRQLMKELQSDPKNRAENLMIVDLLRNDIGRISETGSVQVPELFTVEKYRSVLQMTSTVTGKLKRQVNLFDIFTALFPCGSVTGAPKLRTMEIIRELEDSPRGIYTGAIGMIKPGGDAVFNVPIRTIEIADGRGTMGIGSGIVWDSDPEEEYEECLLKAHFLTQPYKPIELIESMRYENGFQRLDMHLDRLADSARYFDIPVDREEIIKKLNEIESKLDETGVYKIRLTLDEETNIEITYERITPAIEQPVRLKLCTTPTDSNDRFLYHKTNRRELYQSEFQKAQEEGFFDVLFQNERGEITEGAITNVYVKRNDILYTPPVACGLLHGIYRQILLSKNKAKEKIITLPEVLQAKEMYVSNSVRKLLRAQIFMQDNLE